MVKGSINHSSIQFASFGRGGHSGASCTTILVEDGFRVFIACNFAPCGTFLDEPPFLIRDVVYRRTLLELLHKAHNAVLIFRKPSHHSFENFPNLFSCHGIASYSGL